ncbi:MAG: translocation/assembly module TamB domain-containing protein [Pseudomonadota bacterium]
MKRIITGLAVATLLAVPAGGQGSDDDEDSGGFLERTLEDALSGEGRDVSIQGFRGALSSTATMDEMTFSDLDGVWLTLRDVELNWSRAALLRGRVQVDHLRAAEIVLPRPPLPADSAPAAEAGGFSLPELPVSINVGEVSAARVFLGEALFGLETELSVQGALELADGAGQGRIAADRIDGAAGRFVIGGGYDNANQTLTLELDIEEDPGGIVATLAKLPGSPAVAIDLQGDGPLTDFGATLALATDGEDRLQGAFSLQGGEGAPSEFRANVSGDVTPLFVPEFQEFFGPDVSLVVAGMRSLEGELSFDELDLAAQQLALSGQVVIGADGLPRLLDLTGQVAAEDGRPVLLPGTGDATQIDRADLRIAFDASAGESWSADIQVAGLEQGAISVGTIGLTGGGTIVTEETPAVTADLALAAEALDLGDDAVQAAVGDTFAADLSLNWEQGGSLNLPALQVAGATFGLDGNATARFSGNGVDVIVDVDADTADLSPFSALAGQTLTGALSASLEGEFAPVAGLIDVALTGQGEGLSVGIPQVDPLIEGVTDLDLALRRDTTGTYLDRLITRTDAAEITGSGRLETGGGEASIAAEIRDAAVILPGVAGPVTLSAETTGAGRIWDLDLTLAGEGVSTDAELVIDQSRAVAYLSGSLDLEVADIAPFGALAGRDLEGSVNLTARGGGAQDLSALDITLNGQAVDLRTGIEQADALLGGTATLELAAAGIEREITLRNFAIDAPDVALSGEGTVALDGRADLDVSGRLPRPELVASGLPGPLTLTAQTRGGPDAWDVVARVESPDANADVDAAVDISGIAPRVEGTASIAVADLSPFSDLAGRTLGGSVDFRTEGVAVADLSEIDVALRGALDDIVTGIAQADAALAGRTDIDVAIARAGESIAAESLSIENAALRLSGGGRLSLEQEGAADIDLVLLKPEIFVPGLTEPITLSAKAEGGPEVWDIKADLGGELVTGRADVTADISGAVPVVSGDIAFASDDLSLLSDLAGRPLGGAVDLDASGRLTADLSELDLKVDGSLDDIETSVAQADALLAGTTTIDVALQRDASGLSAPGLSIGNQAISLTGSGTLSRTQEGSAEARLVLLDPSAVLAGISEPVTLTARANGGPDLWDIRADIGGGFLTGSVDLDATVSGEVPAVAGDVRLSADDISPFSILANRTIGGAFSVALTGNMAADLATFEAAITGTGRDLRLGQAEIDQLLSGELALNLNAERANNILRVERISIEAPQISVDGSGSVGDAENNADLDVRLANLGAFVPSLPGDLTATLAARQTGGADWSVDLVAAGPGGLQASVDGSAAADFSTLDLQATGQAPLGAAEPFIAPRAIEGTAQFDIAVNGPPSLEAVAGQITASGARLVDPVIGIGVEGLNALVNLNGGAAGIDVSGNLSDGGQVTVAGSLGLTGDLNSDLTVRLVEAGFIDPGVLETSLDGEIRLAGPLAGGASIAGGIILNPTEVLISPSAFSGAGALPDLVHLGEPADVRLTRQRAGLIRTEGAERGGGAVYALDISVDAPNQIFIRGMGLDAELGGGIRIEGTTEAPVPTGEFELVRGRIDVLGRRLTMDEGSASLEGDFDPTIRLVASSDVDDTEILVTVSGPASSPDIEFTSNPELPQDEVIARLLFGQGIENLSPLQAARLASAAANLAGGGGGLFGSVRRGLGLDDLDLGPGGAGGGVGARAGAYVAENVYTDVEINDEGETEITINLDLSPSLTVRAGVGSEGESSLGVFFERDY